MFLIQAVRPIAQREEVQYFAKFFRADPLPLQCCASASESNVHVYALLFFVLKMSINGASTIVMNDTLGQLTDNGAGVVSFLSNSNDFASFKKGDLKLSVVASTSTYG